MAAPLRPFEGAEPSAPRPEPPAHPRLGAPAAVYWYTDERGEPLFAVCRFALEGGDKTFLQGRPRAGGWKWGLDGLEPVLYNLPAVARHLAEGRREPLWFFEGEKDADRAQAEDPSITATTVPMGTHKWRPSYSEYLNGLRLAHVCADNDPAGREGALAAAGELRRIGAEARVLLPALEEAKADVSDHLDRGFGLGALVPLLEEPERGEDAPAGLMRPFRVMPAAEFLAEDDPHAPPLLGTAEETLVTTGGLLIMAGEGGASKTTLTLDAVAHMASGTPWLGWDCPAPVRVLLLENEGPRSKFRQKLAEKSAAWEGEPWLENVCVFADPWGHADFSDEGFRRDLRSACEAEKIGVVAADPLGSLGVVGVGAPDETQQFIGWLKECGLFADTAFWILHHFNKGGSKSTLERLSGAWGGHPDAVLGISLEGKRRTRLSYAKLRWAEPRDEALTLSWTGSRGFSEVERQPEVTDAELRERITEFLREHPEGVSTRAVHQGVQGDNRRLSALLKGEHFAGAFVNKTGNEQRPKWALAEPDALSEAAAHYAALSDSDSAGQSDDGIPF